MSDLKESLKTCLNGIQRVPTLMVPTPIKPIQETNLSQYTVLDCEPLHDLKGHLANLLTELPKKIDDTTLANEIKAVIAIDLESKPTKRGGDYRMTAIHIVAVLRKSGMPGKLLQLMESVLEISEILYADDSERTPKNILRLYNLTWLHYELCTDIFSSTSTISHKKMFGIYLHSIVHHAPFQYEILCLKSANTEHEERLFGQAKGLVQGTTNRQPQTVIPNVLLRLQAKRTVGSVYQTFQEEQSRVSKAAQQLNEGHKQKNTVVSRDFLSGRMSSWQAHLTRISTYLLPGSGIWWRRAGSTYEFFDGSQEVQHRSEGPQLQHFRSKSLKEVYEEKHAHWSQALANNIELPTPYVKVYSDEGKYQGRRDYDEAEEEIEDEPFEIEDEPFEIEDEPFEIEDEPFKIEDEPSEIEDKPFEDEPVELVESCNEPDENEPTITYRTLLAKALSNNIKNY